MTPNNKKQSHVLLKGIHSGQDIYVLGSGSSISYIDRSFFENKIIVGTNGIWKFFPVNYLIVKHVNFMQAAVDAGVNVVISKHDCGDITKPIIDNKGTNYIFTHKRGRFEDTEGNFQENLDSIGKDDDIFVSYSSIASSIHLAAYMGAKNILLIGHDCGYIDGVSHIGDYAQHIKDFHRTEKAFNDYHNTWFERVCQDTIRLKARLKEVYGCNVYSINPFINFGLEGHKYDTKKQ